MTDTSLSDLSQWSDEQDLQLLSDEREEILVDAKQRDDLLSTVSTFDLYQLLLVLSGTRPACSILVHEYVHSREAAEVRTTIPVRFQKTDPVGELLTEYGVPHSLALGLTEIESDERIQVSKDYVISFDDSRLNRFTSALSSPWKSPTREDQMEIGYALDYPEEAVQAWADWDHERDATLFDQLSNDEVLDRVGLMATVISKVGVDASDFVEFLLPYVVPASADCEETAFEDFRDFLLTGLGAIVAHEIDLVFPLFRQHQYNPASED